MKFKVGDRVRIHVPEGFGIPSGEIGTVVEVITEDDFINFPYVLKMDDLTYNSDGLAYMYEEELELINEGNETSILDIIDTFKM